MEISVKNGLIGMNRYLVLRLIQLLKDSSKVRVIMGICREMYEWRLSERFLKIRIQSRCENDWSVTEKLRLCKKMENEAKKAGFNFLKYVNAGELTVLFELFPNPGNCIDTKHQELLDCVLNFFNKALFSHNIEEDFENNCKKAFFSSNREIENEKLSWLCALFKGYNIPSVKKQIATFLTKFYSFPDSYLPLKMECIITSLVDVKFSKPINLFQENVMPEELAIHSREFSQFEAISDFAKIREENKNMLIDNGLTKNLIPFCFSNGIVSFLLRLLSETSSFVHKTRIVHTPGLLSAIAASLSELLSLSVKEVMHWGGPYGTGFNCMYSAIQAISLCCAPTFLLKRRGDEADERDSINTDALAECVAHNIPDLLLRVILELSADVREGPNMFEWAKLMNVASESLFSLFPHTDEVQQKKLQQQQLQQRQHKHKQNPQQEQLQQPPSITDTMTQTTLTQLYRTVDFLAHEMVFSFYPEQELFTVYALVRVGGTHTVEHIITSGVLAELLQHTRDYFLPAFANEPSLYSPVPVTELLLLLRYVCRCGSGVGTCESATDDADSDSGSWNSSMNRYWAVFAENGGVDSLLRLEEMLRGRVGSRDAEWYPKVWEVACISVCYLLRGRRDISLECFVPVLQCAQAKRGGGEWASHAVWEGIIEADAALEKWGEKEKKNGNGF